jgi:hypothetical protein
MSGSCNAPSAKAGLSESPENGSWKGYAATTVTSYGGVQDIRAQEFIGGTAWLGAAGQGRCRLRKLTIASGRDPHHSTNVTTRPSTPATSCSRVGSIPIHPCSHAVPIAMDAAAAVSKLLQ